MTTHRLPQQEQHGRFGSRMERPLLIILFIIAMALFIRQMRGYSSGSLLPTQAPAATLPLIVTQPALQIAPSVQLTPGEGSKGTRITVRGQAWQPGDKLIICLDDVGNDAVPLIYAIVTVNAAGEFVTSFTFPSNVQWRTLPDIPVVVESLNSRERASALFRLLPDTPSPTPSLEASPEPIATPTPTAVPPTPTATCAYGTSFVADVTIPDDSIILPGVSFVKTWRIHNSGACLWRAGTSWVFTGGSQMGGPSAVPVPLTNPGETADISVNLIAPNLPGVHTGYWALRTPEGTTLSQGYFVRIVVPASTVTPTLVAPTATPAPVTPTATPVLITPTPAIINWRGQYFNNTTLTGTPALVRDDPAVNFNWGAGAPAAGLPVDNFSVRWTRSLYFEAGAYRFYVHSDDGASLWLDNNLILDEWHSATGETYLVEVGLSTGNHILSVEYYEALGNAQLQVWWQRVGNYPNWRSKKATRRGTPQ